MMRFPLLAMLLAVVLCRAADTGQVHTIRQWRQLHRSAKTKTDFLELARYSTGRAVRDRAKVKGCQSELDHMLASPVAQGTPPKWPSREQILRQLIGNYRESAERWDSLAHRMRQKAESLTN